jgi:hypothetical protein
MRFPPTRRWSQLYFLHAYHNGTFIPAVAISSSSRTTQVYVAALEAIKSWIHDNLNLDWAPEVGLFDSKYREAHHR